MSRKCQGRTAKNLQCKLNTLNGDFCSRHKNQAPVVVVDSDSDDEIVPIKIPVKKKNVPTKKKDPIKDEIRPIQKVKDLDDDEKITSSKKDTEKLKKKKSSNKEDVTEKETNTKKPDEEIKSQSKEKVGKGLAKKDRCIFVDDDDTRCSNPKVNKNFCSDHKDLFTDETHKSTHKPNQQSSSSSSQSSPPPKQPEVEIPDPFNMPPSPKQFKGKVHCKGFTQKGTQCRKYASNDGYCYLHGDESTKSKRVPKKVPLCCYYESGRCILPVDVSVNKYAMYCTDHQKRMDTECCYYDSITGLKCKTEKIKTPTLYDDSNCCSVHNTGKRCQHSIIGVQCNGRAQMTRPGIPGYYYCYNCYVLVYTPPLPACAHFDYVTGKKCAFKVSSTYSIYCALHIAPPPPSRQLVPVHINKYYFTDSQIQFKYVWSPIGDKILIEKGVELFGLDIKSAMSNIITDYTKAYRKLAMEHHPDRDGGNEEKFKEIQSSKDAFDTLCGK